MSASLNQLLLDPSDEALIRALDQINDCVRATWRYGKDWRPLVDEIATNADGWSQQGLYPGHVSIGGKYLMVAWWTDHQGRKHVRVAAGNTEDGERHPHYSRLDHDERPPLWHIYPPAMFRVHREGRDPVWRVCCPCGEVGDPAALAWMGDCCGPCHDRREEGLPAVKIVSLEANTFHEAISPLDVSSTGQIACSVEDRLYQIGLETNRVLDLNAPFSDCRRVQVYRFWAIQFSPDGRFLVAPDNNAWRIPVWSVESEEWVGEVALPERGRQMHLIVFSPGGHYLGWCNDHGTAVVWAWNNGRVGPAVRLLIEEVSTLAFPASARHVTIGGQDGTICHVDVHTGELIQRVRVGIHDEEVLWLSYLPGDDRLLLLTGWPHTSELGWCLRCWNAVANREEKVTSLPSPIVDSALSPDGRTFAYLTRDDRHSPAEVTFWNVERWQPVGTLAWDTEADLRVLAFAPDGETLISGCVDGVVKRWPWRALLEAGD
ncbi:MAG: WD40 repeat domain-containing protein [Gemmataceae bacterium]